MDTNKNPDFYSSQVAHSQADLIAILGKISDNRFASIPFKYLNRHGLIAGSTGTGKSRAMQVLAEQLSNVGVNVFVSDVKGDASGFCVAGNEPDKDRSGPFKPHSIKTNYWSVGDRFAQLRFSVNEIGPVLMSRLLSLNPTQESHLALAFSYVKRNKKQMDNLDQFLSILDEMVKTNQKGISGSSISVIERKIIAMQESGLGNLFGAPFLDIGDLHGMNVLNLSNVRNNLSVSIAPAFLLQLLFNTLPEVGDSDKPKFAIFFDEAHYLFKDANKSLRDLMINILKQIRSKGVAVFFITQDVTDIPEEILSQLSTKIIFSQKIFTQKGTQRLKALSNSFPKSNIDVLEKLKTMPTGVALISTLNSNGNQTEPKEVRILTPTTTMEIVSDNVLLDSTDQALIRKYQIMVSKKNSGQLQSKNKPEQESQYKSKEKIIKKTIKNERAFSIWDLIFKFLLKLLDFILKVLGKLFSFVIFKPGKNLFKWLVKKPIRILWFLLFLLLVYAIVVNWEIIQGFFGLLKFD
ncbi:MAG: helicase HerA-like domain-containing protein [Candidatus Micrarchaeota archaeon]